MRRNTDAENCFGDVMPDTTNPATVHIRPNRSGDVQLKLQNYETAKAKCVEARAIVVCGSPSNTVVTAAYISVPPSSTVFVDILATFMCSGKPGATATEAGSAGAFRYNATLVASGAIISFQSAPSLDGKPGGTAVLTGSGFAAPTICLCAMQTGTTPSLLSGSVPVTLLGIANEAITWGLLIHTVTLYSELH